MLRFRKKSLEDSIADLRVPEHADPRNKADAQTLVDTVQRHFHKIQTQMQKPASQAQELSVLAHIASIEVAPIAYGLAVAKREAVRQAPQPSRRPKDRTLTEAPVVKTIDSAHETRMAKTLVSKANTIAKHLRVFYTKVFDERRGS